MSRDGWEAVLGVSFIGMIHSSVMAKASVSVAVASLLLGGLNLLKKATSHFQLAPVARVTSATTFRASREAGRAKRRVNAGSRAECVRPRQKMGRERTEVVVSGGNSTKLD